MIFVISGPSGVGKSFLCKDCVKLLDKFYLPRKHTTRKRRMGEDDAEYLFVSESEFNDNNDFIVKTNIYNNWYGLSKAELHPAISGDMNAIFVLDVFLAQTFKEKLPGVSIIFILPVNVGELISHLRSREALYNEKVDKRIEMLNAELEQHKSFDYVIPHMNGESSFDLLKSIIISAFCRQPNFSMNSVSSFQLYSKIYPKLAVDAVVFDHTRTSLLLIERLKEPKGWALPGGFVENNESVESALRRELREETGLELTSFNQLGVFSEPERDPRLHVVSIAFIAFSRNQPIAGSDAKTARWFLKDQLPTPLAFDHADIIKLALETLKKVG